MKALVYLGNQQVVVREEPAPTPADGEAIILMRAAAICGSELGGVKHNDPSRKVPLIMGHEFVGVRADTGQLVAVNPLVTCGTCDRCLAGQQNLCRTRALIGVHRSGGFAEEVAVPIGNIHELPAGTSVLAAVLIEPLAERMAPLALERRNGFLAHRDYRRRRDWSHDRTRRDAQWGEKRNARRRLRSTPRHGPRRGSPYGCRLP